MNLAGQVRRTHLVNYRTKLFTLQEFLNSTLAFGNNREFESIVLTVKIFGALTPFLQDLLSLNPNSVNIFPHQILILNCRIPTILLSKPNLMESGEKKERLSCSISFLSVLGDLNLIALMEIIGLKQSC